MQMIAKRTGIHPGVVRVHGRAREGRRAVAVAMPRRFPVDVNRNEDVAIVGITFFEAFAQIFGVNPRIRRGGRGGQGHFADGVREIFLLAEEIRARGREQCCCWRCRCCYR